MRRSHLVLAVVLVAVVVLCVSGWVNEGPLWRVVMLEKIPLDVYYSRDGKFSGLLNLMERERLNEEGELLHEIIVDDHAVCGWATVKRWTDPPVQHGNLVCYIGENGFKAKEEEYKDGDATKGTEWNFDGTVSRQIRSPWGRGRTSPPWWWGVKDQTEPTAPWWPWWNEKQQ